MSDPLTLTGATMTSKTDKNCCDTKDVELGGGLQGLPQQTPSLNGHSHGGGHNHHHHHHQHEKKCCDKHAPKQQQPVQVVYRPPSKEDLEKATPEQIRLSLTTMVRFGGFDDAFVPMMTLVEEHRKKIFNEIMTSLGTKDSYSLLHWAAKRDDVRFLRHVLEKNTALISTPSSDKVAMHPLHWCATSGSIKNAATLIDKGANLEATDGAGCTPLILAAQYGHVNLVAFLLQKGANGRALDSSRDSALHWAAYKGSIQVCGHLLFRKELDWTSIDAYGQTPLHLASLRGHVPVVRYLLEEGSREEGRRVLHLPDKNGKTCHDLAVQKNRPAVAACLLEFQELYATRSQKSYWKMIQHQVKGFFSVESWKLWFGCAADAHTMDVAPKFPFYFTLFHMFLYTLFFPLVFCPFWNTSEGILWDYTGFLVFQMCSCAVMWYAAYKVYYTNPGTLDESHPETSIYRKIYEETIENLGAELEGDAQQEQLRRQRQLCHTCHIVRPIRSKHCRNARRCVLMFDHYCPFVGASIGLYNYPWFYLDLFSMSICCVTFMVTLYIYLSRQFTYTILFSGIYLSLFILFAGGMCLYHTQLTMFNLTTNEHMNLGKYDYLTAGNGGRRIKGMTFGPGGSFHNPFFTGWWSNAMMRLYNPSKATYTLPEKKQDNEKELLTGPNIV